MSKLCYIKYTVFNFKYAGVVELVDAIDSKSIIGNYVWVRVPPPAPMKLLFKIEALTSLCKYDIIISDVTFVNSVASVSIGKFNLGNYPQGGKTWQRLYGTMVEQRAIMVARIRQHWFLEKSTRL